MTDAKRKLSFVIIWMLYALLFGSFLPIADIDFLTIVSGLITIYIVGLALYYGNYHLKLRYFLIIAVIVSLLSSCGKVLIYRNTLILDETSRLVFFYQCIVQTVTFSTSITVLQHIVQCLIAKKVKSL